MTARLKRVSRLAARCSAVAAALSIVLAPITPILPTQVAHADDVTVSSDGTSDVTQTDAVVAGTVTGGPVDQEGITYDTTSHSSGTDDDYPYVVHASDPSQGSISEHLLSLSCGTTYYYRAYAILGLTHYFGDEESFTAADCPSPPTIGFNNTSSQASPSDAYVVIDVHVNDTQSDPASLSVRYSLDGGDTWDDADHLSFAAFPISGNSVTGITTYGDGLNNHSNVAFRWDFTKDNSVASTTDAEIEVTPHDASGDGEPLVSDPFTLKAPLAPPLFADDSGAVTDIEQTTVIVHYDMESIGSAPLHHFELHYADDAYFSAHDGSYAENTPITYTASFATSGATTVDSLACGITYHFIQSFTNADGETATSSDATFTTSDCDEDGGGDEGAPFAGGDGSPESPWVIDDCSEIPMVNNHLGDSFILADSLDCSDMGNDVMIGGIFSDAFTGDFDGNGNYITVDIEDPEESVVGLFRAILGGSVHDLSISGDSEIIGADVVGSIAGVALDATLTRVSSSASVTAANPNPSNYPLVGTGGLVGGLYGGAVYGSTYDGLITSQFLVGGIAGMAANDLMGDNPGALISRSSTDATVYGQLGAGGLVGYMQNGVRIRNSFAEGMTLYYSGFGSSSSYGAIGGLVGLMADGLISRSYAAGTVRDTNDDTPDVAGGLVGAMEDPADTAIIHSFSAASINTTSATVGGFVGDIDEEDAPFEGFYDDYLDTDATGFDNCVGGEEGLRDGCVAVDGSADGYWLGTHETPLSAWNSDDVWDFSGEDSDFPTLRAYEGPEPEESDEFVGGDSGEGDEDGGDEGTSTPPTRRHVIRHASSVPLGLLSAGSAASFQAQLGSLQTKYQALLAQAQGRANTLVAASSDIESGATGTEVVALQKLLIGNGNAIPAGATGFFGAQTKAALAAYQKAHGVAPAAGYFGPLTRAEMKSAGLSNLWW